MWTFNYFDVAQNESGKIDPDKAHSFQKRNSWKFLMVVVQMSTSKVKYSTYKRTGHM